MPGPRSATDMMSCEPTVCPSQSICKRGAASTALSSTLSSTCLIASGSQRAAGGRPLFVVGEEERRDVGDERAAIFLAQLELALGESGAQHFLAQLLRAPPRAIVGAQFGELAVVQRRRQPAERALDRVVARRDPP